MLSKDAIKLIEDEVEIARQAMRNVSGRKLEKARGNSRKWQSCLEVATQVYHSDEAGALERIMALKLGCKLGLIG